jgi:hypothetical protein
MKAKLRNKWTTALRSGEYRQCRGALRDGKGGFCCLGVLRRVGAQNGIRIRKSRSGELLTESCGLSTTEQNVLATMNDGDSYGENSKTFAQIANYIENTL